MYTGCTIKSLVHERTKNFLTSASFSLLQALHDAVSFSQCYDAIFILKRVGNCGLNKNIVKKQSEGLLMLLKVNFSLTTIYSHNDFKIL